VQSQAPTLVIVDDDPDVLNALRFAFEIDGYEVQTYPTGEKFLEAGLARIACIILDQRLPGITGIETTSLLRSRGVSAPIILITTRPTFNLRRSAEATGAHIVEKPLLTDALARKVREVLAASGEDPHC
jgi:FixJ family two-component response regulator